MTIIDWKYNSKELPLFPNKIKIINIKLASP